MKPFKEIGIKYGDGTPIREFDILCYSSTTFMYENDGGITQPQPTFCGEHTYVVLYSKAKCAYCLCRINKEPSRFITRYIGSPNSIESLHQTPITDYRGRIFTIKMEFTKVGNCHEDKYKHILSEVKNVY